MPTSASKSKIASSDINAAKLTDFDLGSQSGDFIDRQSLKKRDNSLDIKRKTDKIENIIPSSSSYLYGNASNGASSSSGLSSLVGGSSNSRWTSNSKSYKPHYSYGKDSFENSNGLTVLNSSNAALPEEGESATVVRRPMKYTSNALKYGEKNTGSKTEKIISKSSKSSPNLISKERDYDHLYTDR